MLILHLIPALATELVVTAKDGTAVVLVNEVVKGQTPVTAEVDGGSITLGFRSSMFGPVLFTENVVVPDKGTFTVEVDLDERVLVTSGGADGGTDPVATPETPAATGKLKVTVTPKKAEVLLDGEKVGVGTIELPAVPVGPHTLALRLDGTLQQEREVTVEAGVTLEVAMEIPVISTGTEVPPPVVKDPAGKPSKVPRILLNTVVTGAGLAVLPFGFYNYSQAKKAHNDYNNLPVGLDREQFFDEQVAPRQTAAFVEWGVGGALVATGAVLWITTFTDSPIVVAPTGRGLRLDGRF